MQVLSVSYHAKPIIHCRLITRYNFEILYLFKNDFDFKILQEYENNIVHILYHKNTSELSSRLTKIINFWIVYIFYYYYIALILFVN